jgi:hypothetical protein
MGGNLGYGNGSRPVEANAISGDYNVEYTVYVGTTAADTDVGRGIGEIAQHLPPDGRVGVDVE